MTQQPIRTGSYVIPNAIEGHWYQPPIGVVAFDTDGDGKVDFFLREDTSQYLSEKDIKPNILKQIRGTDLRQSRFAFAPMDDRVKTFVDEMRHGSIRAGESHDDLKGWLAFGAIAAAAVVAPEVVVGAAVAGVGAAILADCGLPDPRCLAVDCAAIEKMCANGAPSKITYLKDMNAILANLDAKGILPPHSQVPYFDIIWDPVRKGILLPFANVLIFEPVEDPTQPATTIHLSHDPFNDSGPLTHLAIAPDGQIFLANDHKIIRVDNQGEISTIVKLENSYVADLLRPEIFFAAENSQIQVGQFDVDATDNARDFKIIGIDTQTGESTDLLTGVSAYLDRCQPSGNEYFCRLQDGNHTDHGYLSFNLQTRQIKEYPNPKKIIEEAYSDYSFVDVRWLGAHPSNGESLFRVIAAKDNNEADFVTSMVSINPDTNAITEWLNTYNIAEFYGIECNPTSLLDYAQKDPDGAMQSLNSMSFTNLARIDDHRLLAVTAEGKIYQIELK
ncbi:MAG: hypothetical protein Q7T03_10015 [Deltaproteobacteria bacterium]|nr:hypothetical protein [Deltaproteobacteria bacterium]